MCVVAVRESYGANATWLLIASNASLARTWVALTLAYQVEPPALDWLAAWVFGREDAQGHPQALQSNDLVQDKRLRQARPGTNDISYGCASNRL